MKRGENNSNLRCLDASKLDYPASIETQLYIFLRDLLPDSLTNFVVFLKLLRVSTFALSIG